MSLVGALLCVQLASAPAATIEKVGGIVAASQSRPDFDRTLADLLDELALALAGDKPARFSPVVVDHIAVSPNLSEELRARLPFLLSAALRKVPELEEVQCIACGNDIASRFENGAWVLSVGNTGRDGMRARAERTGARSVLRIAIEWLEKGDTSDRLTLSASLVAPATGEVLWAKRVQSDDDRAVLERDPKKLQSLEARKAELAEHWRHLPSFGIGVLLGLMQIPFQLRGGPGGSINGLSIALRLHEVFGPNRELAVGLQGMAFIDPVSTLPLSKPLPVAGGIATLYVGYALKFRDVRLPTFRLTAHTGGYLAGSLGNNFTFGGMLEAQMRFRLGFNFALLYIVPTDLMPQLMISLDIGGLTWFVGTSFTWD